MDLSFLLAESAIIHAELHILNEGIKHSTKNKKDKQKKRLQGVISKVEKLRNQLNKTLSTIHGP